MNRLMRIIDSQDVIKRIQAGGWCLVRITGSHHHSKHEGKAGIVTVPHPRKDLAKGALNSIWKQAGLKNWRHYTIFIGDS